jgi:hypothetical protein
MGSPQHGVNPMLILTIGKGITLSIDETKIPAEVAAHCMVRGLQDILTDTHAGIKVGSDNFVELSRAAAEKKLAALMAGELRVASTRTSDPVAREAKAIAAAYLKTKGVKTDADNYKELLAKVAATPSVVAKAQQRVQEVAELSTDIEI